MSQEHDEQLALPTDWGTRTQTQRPSNPSPSPGSKPLLQLVNRLPPRFKPRLHAALHLLLQPARRTGQPPQPAPEVKKLKQQSWFKFLGRAGVKGFGTFSPVLWGNPPLSGSAAAGRWSPAEVRGEPRPEGTDYTGPGPSHRRGLLRAALPFCGGRGSLRGEARRRREGGRAWSRRSNGLRRTYLLRLAVWSASRAAAPG